MEAASVLGSRLGSVPQGLGELKPLHVISKASG
jgi:hypothetical protein